MIRLAVTVLMLTVAVTVQAESPKPAPPEVTNALKTTKAIKVSWGEIAADQSVAGRLLLTVNAPPSDGVLQLPPPFPNIVRSYLASDAQRNPLTLSFNKDATQIMLQLPAGFKAGQIVVVETTEKWAQLSDGVIMLSALDSKVIGKRAKLESHPGSHRIGFWSDASDGVQWTWPATRWGMYDLELTYSLAGGTSDVVIQVGDIKLKTTIKATGSWYRYTTVSLGRVYLEKAGKHVIHVACTKKTGGAVMNLKAVLLRPAPEGKPIVQGETGEVVCHARDVTIQGVMLRWEPAEKKQTVGFWANENDWCYWAFELRTPGRFKVEVLQGCGKGHGGSDAVVEVANQSIDFVVKDTGHFQAFEPRVIGEINIEKPGRYRIVLRAKRKAKGAVMDCRQIRLVPVR